MICYFALYIFIDYFIDILTDNLSNQTILIGPVQIALSRTEGCILRPKQMFGNGEVFKQISRTDLLY